MTYSLVSWVLRLAFLAATYGLIVLFFKREKLFDRVMLGVLIVLTISLAIYVFLSYFFIVSLVIYCVATFFLLVYLVTHSVDLNRGRHVPVPDQTKLGSAFQLLDEIDFSFDKINRFRDLENVLQGYFTALNEKLGESTVLFKLRQFYFDDTDVRRGSCDDILVDGTTYEGAHDRQHHLFVTALKIDLIYEHEASLNGTYTVAGSKEYDESLEDFKATIDVERLRKSILDSIWNCVWQEFYTKSHPQSISPAVQTST